MKATLLFTLKSLMSLSIIVAMLVTGIMTLGASMLAGLMMSLIEWLAGGQTYDIDQQTTSHSPVL
ncbi:MAG: hypothetical protein ACRCT7_10195 [Shewanella sp.]|uniref:hypothetical protein n=1 Tax=Shewanella sp. SNU WT4 TaxID=2590015 RepID=UPI00112B5282|nr:hypothetical protein [Shewanella sp. SNU WT4]QDF66876.1 hypothetical protein FJQ87_09235 [Shewanella sp. SNU WT4]